MNCLTTLRLITALLALSGGLICPAAPAAELAAPSPPAPGTPAPAERAPLLEKLGSGQYRLGGILVDQAQRSLTFPAQVNMDHGMLEYLLVHSRGKTHESLLRTEIEPYELQIAFLLLGFQGSSRRLARQGDPARPEGEPVRITIATAAGQGESPFPAERWLINKFEDRVQEVSALDWVYSGSYIEEGRFLSQGTGSIASIWHDPAAMMDNASPGGESNKIWFVKQGTVPPVGTPVQVSIRPAP